MARRTQRTLTHMLAACDQIDGAIRAYFLWDDLVSAITLAGAAERVLSDIQDPKGLLEVDNYSIRSAINLYIKDEHQKAAAKLFRKEYDFFRHADKDPNEEITLIEESADYWILFAMCSYRHLGGVMTHDMTAFSAWFAAKHPEEMKRDHPIIPLSQKITANTSKREYYVMFSKAVPHIS